MFFYLKLLLDCGLGNGGSSESGTEAVVAQHRVLIFCQLKSMLDIVEHDLLRPQLPSVTYLRLDGSIPAGQRHSIVSRYASSPPKLCEASFDELDYLDGAKLEFLSASKQTRFINSLFK